MMIQVPCVPAPGTPEWLKILISALAGMLTGMAMEPIRYRIQLQIQKRRVRQDIYQELGAIWAIMAFKVTPPQEPFPERYFEFLKTLDFDYYYNRNREAFNALEHSRGIKELYQAINFAKVALDNNWVEARGAADYILNNFSRSFVTGVVDEELLHRCAQDYSNWISKQNIAWARFAGQPPEDPPAEPSPDSASPRP